MPNRIKKERRLIPQDTSVSMREYSVMAFRKSPLPPPEDMTKYENLLPGATKMLFENFITQTNHRMDVVVD
jgi:uncharacterized membrane protein